MPKNCAILSPRVLSAASGNNWRSRLNVSNNNMAISSVFDTKAHREKSLVSSPCTKRSWERILEDDDVPQYNGSSLGCVSQSINDRRSCTRWTWLLHRVWQVIFSTSCHSPPNTFNESPSRHYQRPRMCNSGCCGAPLDQHYNNCSHPEGREIWRETTNFHLRKIPLLFLDMFVFFFFFPVLCGTHHTFCN